MNLLRFVIGVPVVMGLTWLLGPPIRALLVPVVEPAVRVMFGP